MTYDSAKMIDPSGLDVEELRDVGWLPGVPSPLPLGLADGCEIWEHPEAMLRDQPEIAEMVDRFVLLGPEAHLPHDIDELWSAWELEAWLTMRAAYGREQTKRFERSRG